MELERKDVNLSFSFPMGVSFSGVLFKNNIVKGFLIVPQRKTVLLYGSKNETGVSNCFLIMVMSEPAWAHAFL